MSNWLVDLLQIYVTSSSRETISRITHRVVEDMLAWQSRQTLRSSVGLAV